MTKLEQIKLFLDFYFSPWGAAKGEVWEHLTGDSPFEDATALRYVDRLLTGASFTEEDIKMMKMVVA